MNVQDRNKIIAVAVTAISALLVVLFLTSSNLYFEWPPKDEPLIAQNDSSEILFGGEYVVLGDVPEPATNDFAAPEPQPKKVEATAKEPSEPEKLVTSTEESTMKVNPQVVDSKDRKDDKKKADKKEKEVEKQNQEISKSISSNVARGFGKGAGKEGIKTGNTDSGTAHKGSPGFSLAGRTIERWGKPSSTVEGSVVIQVKVNPKGKVIEASYKSGKGSANANMSVRESCRKASLNSQFSVASDRTTNQIGTITWRFE